MLHGVSYASLVEENRPHLSLVIKQVSFMTSSGPALRRGLKWIDFNYLLTCFVAHLSERFECGEC